MSIAVDDSKTSSGKDHAVPFKLKMLTASTSKSLIGGGAPCTSTLFICFSQITLISVLRSCVDNMPVVKVPLTWRSRSYGAWKKDKCW